MKKRILQFIEYKKISKRKFYSLTGISNGTLDKKSGLSEETIEKFISTFPEVNVVWFITGKGEMLEKTTFSNEKNEIENETIDNLNKLIKLQEKQIKILEREKNLQDGKRENIT